MWVGRGPSLPITSRLLSLILLLMPSETALIDLVHTTYTHLEIERTRLDLQGGIDCLQNIELRKSVVADLAAAAVHHLEVNCLD